MARKHEVMDWMPRRPGASLVILLAAVWAVLGAATADAQRALRREVPPSRAALQYSFAPIVRRATPASR